MKKVKNILVALLLAGAAIFSFACNNGGPEACCNNPKDANCDGVCDNCKAMDDATNAALPCAGAGAETSNKETTAYAEVGKK